MFFIFYKHISTKAVKNQDKIKYREYIEGGVILLLERSGERAWKRCAICAKSCVRGGNYMNAARKRCQMDAPYIVQNKTERNLYSSIILTCQHGRQIDIYHQMGMFISVLLIKKHMKLLQRVSAEYFCKAMANIPKKIKNSTLTVMNTGLPGNLLFRASASIVPRKTLYILKNL